MDTLPIHDDPNFLAAVGTVAIRHGQLDYMLRLTIKSIAPRPFQEVVDETRHHGSPKLRNRARKLAKKKIGEGEALRRFDKLLGRSQGATDERNELMHNVIAHDKKGNPVVRDGEGWHSIPTVRKLERIASELATVAADLNDARLEGFLKDALTPANPPLDQA